MSSPRASSVRILAAVGAAVVLAAVSGGCAWIAGVSQDVHLVDVSDAGDGATADVTRDAAGDDVRPITSDASDAGDAGVLEGGPAPDAGTDPLGLQCASTTCALATQACCYPSAGGGAACTTKVNPTCTGLVAQCDEAIDCPNGQVCCINTIAAYGVKTTCQPSCDPSERQACRTSAECGTGSCLPFRCAGSTMATCDGKGAEAGCVP